MTAKMLRRLQQEHQFMPELLSLLSAFRFKTVDVRGSEVVPFQLRSTQEGIGELS